MKTIVITGGTGLVGAHLLPLLDCEADLHLLTRSLPAYPVPGVCYHPVDLAGEFDEQHLPSRIDGVVYLAQSEHFREFPSQALDMLGVNVMAPLRLLDYARRAGAKKFIYASSGGVYGSSADLMREDARLPARGGLGYYLSTKLCGEILAENYASLLDVSLLRFFFVYGPRQKRQMLIPRLIGHVLRGQPVNLQGRDGIRINPVHAEDAARAVRACLELSGSRTINIAGPKIHSIREICNMIGSEVGREPIFTMTKSSDDLVADISTMSDVLHAPSRLLSRSLPAQIDEQRNENDDL